MSLVHSAVIGGAADLLEAERVIAACLRGESGRCSFLRSEAYVRLRLAALYSPSPAPVVAYHERLRVSLAPDGRLSVYWADQSEPPDARVLGSRCFEPPPACEAGTHFEQACKRGRHA